MCLPNRDAQALYELLEYLRLVLITNAATSLSTDVLTRAIATSLTRSLRGQKPED